MKSYKFITTILAVILLAQLVLVNFALAAPDGNCSGDAWGEKVGFIRFSDTNPEYGVTVTDSALSGYAWGEKTGWIHFSGNCTSGTTGICDGGTYGVVNDGSGNLSDYAWGEKAGFIKMSGTNYGVTVYDTYLSGYAWGEKTGWIRMHGETGTCIQPGDGCVGGYTYAVANDGNGNLSGYAWGEKVGWISFSGTAGDSAEYGVTVTDSALSGYAWGEKTGWIKFSGDCTSGTTGICNGGTYGVVNDGDGNLSGYAWSEKGGWISLSGTAGDSSTYQVTIDGDGNFDGYARGEKIGWIHFKHSVVYIYGVTTSWTANQAPTITSVSTTKSIYKSGKDGTSTDDPVIFTSVASDPGDTIKLYVCKNSLCANCEPSDTSNCWAVSTAGSETNPSATYTSSACDDNTYNYWAKVCDGDDACSSVKGE